MVEYDCLLHAVFFMYVRTNVAAVCVGVCMDATAHVCSVTACICAMYEYHLFRFFSSSAFFRCYLLFVLCMCALLRCEPVSIVHNHVRYNDGGVDDKSAPITLWPGCSRVSYENASAATDCNVPQSIRCGTKNGKCKMAEEKQKNEFRRRY